jgi:hypothetical protein
MYWIEFLDCKMQWIAVLSAYKNRTNGETNNARPPGKMQAEMDFFVE